MKGTGERGIQIIRYNIKKTLKYFRQKVMNIIINSFAYCNSIILMCVNTYITSDPMPSDLLAQCHTLPLLLWGMLQSQQLCTCIQKAAKLYTVGYGRW